MGYGRVIDLEGSGIWKSPDKGVTWTQLESTANGELFEAINRIIIDPDDENIVLVCSNNSFTSTGPNGGDRKSGIFRTTDGGVTWIQVFNPEIMFGAFTDNRVQQIIATPGNFNVLFATVNEVGVVKSEDAGLTWEVSADNFALSQDIGVGQGTYSGVSTRTELAIAPSDPNRIYASVEKPFGSAQLFMSKDGGESWKLVPNEGADINWHSAFGGSGADGAYTSGWFNNTIAVHPFDENIVFVGGVNLFRININANSDTRTIHPVAWWFAANEFEVPYVHADNHLLTMITDTAGGTFRIVCPNDGGVAYSPDGGVTWVQKNGMVTTQFYGVDKKPGEDVYIGGMQDNGTWLSQNEPGAGSAWAHVIGGDGFETVWNHNDPNFIMGTSQNGFVRRSMDGGNSWTLLSDARKGGGPFISKIANSTSDPDLVFTVTLSGVNRSDDFGSTWNEANLTPWIGYRPFSNVSISDANPRVIWAASRLAPDPFGNTGGVFVSIDGGLTFTNISNNIPLGVSEASGLATHPTDEGTAYLLFSAPGKPKIYRTTDYGLTWEDLSGFHSTARTSPTGFPDVAVFDLLVMPFDSNQIWAGTEIGLFISEDGGQTWAIADNGFPSASVFDLKIRDTQVVVATYGRGIWSAELPELENYVTPVVTLAPRLSTLAFLPTGNIQVSADLRSAYDSIHIVIDNVVQMRIYNNMAGSDTTLIIPVTQDVIISAGVTGFKDGVVYSSPNRNLEVFLTQPQESYVNLINETLAKNDFTGNGFSVRTQPGFSSRAIHSLHPYPDGIELLFQLKIPIIVAGEDALMRYSDVVIVEEGESADFTDAGFFDFVVVEGTTDGINWLALAPGYDSRADSKWSAAYNAQQNGDETMYKNHEINLLDTFNPGDILFIRFRLQADGFVTGWGWAIDNIIIQQNVVTAIEETPYPDFVVYPNPVQEKLVIAAGNSRKIDQVLINDLSGITLYSSAFSANLRQIEINVSELQKGVYIMRIQSGDELHSFRFIKN